MRLSNTLRPLLLTVCLALATTAAATSAERRKTNIPLQPQPQFVPSDIDEANAVYISGKGNAPSHAKARFASSSSYDSWSHPRFGPLTENELLVSSESKLPPITFKQDTVIDTSGSSHWPMAGAGTRPLQPGYRHPSFRAVNGIRVADNTRVVNQTNLEDDHPDVVAYRKFIADYNKNVWTPDGRTVYPNDTDGVARAIALARNSFIVVDVTDRYSHMHVFYIDPQTDNNNRSTLPWRARITRFGKIGGEDQGSSCTGLRNDIDGIPTSLMRGAMLPDKVQRFEHMLAVLTAMYARCKHTVFEALTLPNDDAELGLLRTLNVRRKKGTDLLDRLKSHIEVWFNNVNIHFEGSATYRILQENMAKIGNHSTLDSVMWKNIRVLDSVLRNNTGHLTTRVLPGVWQSYFGFIGVRDWLARNRALRSNVNNILYIAYQATVNLAVRVGPSRVRLYPRSGLNTSKSSEESSHHEESSEESSETSFLEMQSQTQAKGNVSLVYPLNDNPGTLYCKSFFGMGHYTMMAEILKWHVKTLGESLLPGDRVLVPCLAKGVRIERRKLFSNSVVAHEVCFATHRKFGEPFSEHACEEFSRHKVLVQALSVKNIYFEGTSDHRQCKAVIREFLRGKDLHNIRRPWAKQLSHLVRPGGPVDADAKRRIKHVAIASMFFEEVLRTSLKNKYEGVPKYALEFGVSMKQALAIFRSLSGPRFGGQHTDDMGPNDWVLPLVGAFTEILLVEKLQFDPDWQGRVYLRRFRWIHGMKEVYADLQATKDARYEELYDMVQYRVPTRAKDPEDMPYIDDLSLVPSRGYLMAHPDWKPSVSNLESKKDNVKKALARKQRELSRIYTPKQSESSWVSIPGSGGSVPISGSLSASARSSGSSSSSESGSSSRSSSSFTSSSSSSFSESAESGSRESSENSLSRA